jgi:hypothetical protein
MGQPVAVISKPSRMPGVLRFEANRSLTGMGHVRYRKTDHITGTVPSDELARRFFATGQVDAIHIYANMITADLAKGFTGEGLEEIVADLFIHYRDGVMPATFDETPAADEKTASPAAPAEGGADAPALSAEAQKIPANLLERSRAARIRLLGH